MENKNNEQAFWQFSDQLRFQSSCLSNLSRNNSIWNNSYAPKKAEDRRNFDFRSGTEINAAKSANGSDWNGLEDGTKLGRGGAELGGSNQKRHNRSEFNRISNWNSFDGCQMGCVGAQLKNSKPKATDRNVYDDMWNLGCGSDDIWNNPLGSIRLAYGGLKTNMNLNTAFGSCVNPAVKHNKIAMGEDEGGVKSSKKSSKKSVSSGEDAMDSGKNATDQRFKTLPPTEALRRSETIGGYIFVCNNDTMQENLRRQLFGLPPRYRDSVRTITPGLPLFLYNYTTHQLHGIYEAASFGGTNIDPTAWEDKKSHGESRFPAQVKMITRKVCEPLEEDSFRPILHHYDGPKFRLELNVPEAMALLDIFDRQSQLLSISTTGSEKQKGNSNSNL